MYYFYFSREKKAKLFVMYHFHEMRCTSSILYSYMIQLSNEGILTDTPQVYVAPPMHWGISINKNKGTMATY